MTHTSVMRLLVIDLPSFFSPEREREGGRERSRRKGGRGGKDEKKGEMKREMKRERETRSLLTFSYSEFDV